MKKYDARLSRMTENQKNLGLLLNGEPGGGGTDNYEDLKNKPKLEGITLEGDKKLEDVGIKIATAAEVEAILNA